jgi:hypothetical protein
MEFVDVGLYQTKGFPMNQYFIVAGGLAFSLGLVHSLLGELLIFRRLPKDVLPPLAGSTDLTWRTLRMTWHIPTVFAWGFGAILLQISFPSSPNNHLVFVENVMVLSFFACSLIAVFITKGKHPGWIVMLSITILLYLG